jgi:transposase
VIANTPEALHGFLQVFLAQYPKQLVVIAIESTRSALLPVFRQYQDQLTVYLLNPITLAKYREAFRPSGAKDDWLDCQLLADIVIAHPDQLHAWRAADPHNEQLAALNEDRRTLVDMRTQLANQLKQRLKLYFPHALDFVNDDLTTPFACEFVLQWSTLESLQKAKPQEIRRWMQARRHRLTDAVEKAIEQLPKAVAVTNQVAWLEPANRYVQVIAQQLKTLHPQIKAYDQQIALLVSEHPMRSVAAELPGAGPVMKARLLASLGTDPLRFDQAETLQVLSGIAPVKRASGQSQVIQRRRACSRFLHQSFLEYADQSWKWSKWAGSFVAYKKGKSWKHYRIIRALAFKWIRILVALMKSGQTYDEAKYMEVLAKKNCPYLKNT